MNINNVLLLTEGDPWGMPTGGQTTFAKHLLIAFKSRLAISSFCDEKSIPVGKWIQRSYGDSLIWFFNRGSMKWAKDSKPLIPGRIQAYFKTRKFMRKIREIEFSGLFIDSPEMLFAVSPYSWKSVCYRFAGVNNPVANSRYSRSRALGKYFEKYHIATLNRMNPDVIIASADQDAIDEFHERTGNILDQSRFYQFPTRVDTELFFPIDNLQARMRLDLPLEIRIFVATGRLCWIKGWDLLLDALANIKKELPNSILIFVGDGEDHNILASRAKALCVYENIKITGFIPQQDVALYMNAADVCLVASHREGWSLAMCEMLACGKPVVTTNVSGAQDMVKNGRNGYIVSERDPKLYANAVFKAINLENANEYSLKISEKYAVKNLAHELRELWGPLDDIATKTNKN